MRWWHRLEPVDRVGVCCTALLVLIVLVLVIAMFAA